MPIEAPAGTGPAIGIMPPGTELGAFTATLGTELLGVVDDTGVRIHVAKLTGWWDTPGSTGTVEQRAMDHGGHVNTAFYTPRVIDAELRLIGADWGHVRRSLDRVQAAIPLSALDSFTVADPDQVLSARVRQHGDPLVDRRGPTARLSLSLIAPDPRKYELVPVVLSTGLPTTSGGLRAPLRAPFRVGATTVRGILFARNDGNLATRPVLTVAGPCAPFTLTHRGTGQVLSYGEAIPAGRFVTIDTDRREVLLDGTARRPISGSWFEYAPGLNEIAFNATSYDAGAQLTSTHYNAWK